jgi:hypothetical protein
MNDSVLNKIALQMRIKQVKVENISRALGISAGEFSKVINGQRKQYHKYLPGIAAYLEMSPQELLKPEEHGSTRHRSDLCLHCARGSKDLQPQHFEAILRSKDELIDSLKEMIQLYKQQLNGAG